MRAARTIRAISLGIPQFRSIVANLSCDPRRRFARDGGLAPNVRHRTVRHLPRQRRAPALGRAHGAHRHDARVRRGAARSDRTYARTRIGAFFAGVGITGILQSSTATTMLLASFAARGLIALPLALAVVLGADVGSAIVAQVFSFDVKWLWTVLVAIGVLLCSSSTEADKARGVARIFIGLGLMLLALVHIGVPPRRCAIQRCSARCYRPCRRAGARLPRRDPGLVAGSFEPFDRAPGDVACRGARPAVCRLRWRWCSAPMSAARSRHSRHCPARRPPAAACRSAISSMRAALALPVPLPPARSPRWLATIEPNPGRIAHQFPHGFNPSPLLPSSCLRWRCGDAATRLLPDPPQAAAPAKPKHLDATALDSPSDALGCAMRETLHMGDRVADMLRHALIVFEKSDAKL